GVLTHLGGGDPGSPVGDGDRGGPHQPHITEETPARVPAGRPRRVVQPDREDVLPAWDDMLGEVHAPAVVAVGPAAHQDAVQPHRCIGHRAVDLEVHGTTGVLLGDVEL